MGGPGPTVCVGACGKNWVGLRPTARPRVARQHTQPKREALFFWVAEQR